MLSSEIFQPVKRMKVSIVSDDPASTSSKVGAQEGFKESEPESETMIMNDQQPEPVIRSLEDQLLELQTNYDELQQKYVDDMAKMQQKLFRLERFIASDHEFRFYTGFPDFATFKVFFDYLSPACNNLIYYGHPNGTETVVISEEHKKSGRARTLSPEQELFMVLVRLRCSLLLEDVAHRFNLSLSHVSRIWVTWVNFLHQQLRILPIWPSRAFVDENMPQCFKSTYPSTRVIIDCTEIFLEMPSSCRSQSATFSTYKHNNTAKGLLGISPVGFPSFVSNLYAGRVSDKKITKDCGILKLFEPGDQVMADRGFDLEDDLPAGVKLNIPAFLEGKDQLSAEDEIVTRRIASVRVHVERAIARIKSFRILKQVFPLKSIEQLDKIWTICTYTSLFMPPLINETDPHHCKFNVAMAP